jgi:peptidoglycan hydrolase-like protein with peptidoglycan-binding domain
MMHGSDVKWVQQHLNSHDAKLTVDSEFGPKTRDAVKAFQRKQKLEVDGIVGPKAWAALAK